MNDICPLAQRSERASYEGAIKAPKTRMSRPKSVACLDTSYKPKMVVAIPKWAITFSCSLRGKTTVSGTVVLGSSPDGRTLCSDSSIGRERRRSRQNAPVEHFERVSKQLFCEGGTTRQVQVLMPKGLRVRFSSEVNTYKWRNWYTRLPQKQLSSGNMGSSPILYITGK